VKIAIECESQEEFESNVDNIVKAVKGEPKLRRSIYKAQNEILDHWDKQYKTMIKELKDDITKILHKK